MENPLYISLFTASGFIISPLMMFIFQAISENKKHKRELDKIFLAKKLEAAERFVGKYSFYLDAVSRLVNALDQRAAGTTPEAMTYINNVINNAQQTMNQFDDDEGANTSNILLYFDVTDDIIDTQKSIEHFNSWVKFLDAKARYAESSSSEHLQIQHQEGENLKRLLTDLVDENRPKIAKVVKEIKKYSTVK